MLPGNQVLLFVWVLVYNPDCMVYTFNNSFQLKFAIVEAVLGFLSGEISGDEGTRIQIQVGVSQGLLGLSVHGTVFTVPGTATGKARL